jgi:ammonia channel protein AmtB
MVGFFADPSFVTDGQEGVFYGGGKQLGYQIMAVMAYSCWALVTSGIMFTGLSYLGLLRVDREVELKGLDDHHHGGYPYRIKSCPETDDINTTKHTIDEPNSDESDDAEEDSKIGME